MVFDRVLCFCCNPIHETLEAPRCYVCRMTPRSRIDTAPCQALKSLLSQVPDRVGAVAGTTTKRKQICGATPHSLCKVRPAKGQNKGLPLQSCRRRDQCWYWADLELSAASSKSTCEIQSRSPKCVRDEPVQRSLLPSAGSIVSQPVQPGWIIRPLSECFFRAADCFLEPDILGISLSIDTNVTSTASLWRKKQKNKQTQRRGLSAMDVVASHTVRHQLRHTSNTVDSAHWSHGTLRCESVLYQSIP